MSDQSVIRTSNPIAVALRELIRLKDLKTDALAIETSGSWSEAHRQQGMLREYHAARDKAWDAARRALTEHALETREPPRQLELTNELRWILGRPCFMVIPMVQCLRNMGRHIDTKAEDEQAVAIHWMLSLYLEHGADKWRDEAEKILKEGQRQANELKANSCGCVEAHEPNCPEVQ